MIYSQFIWASDLLCFLLFTDFKQNSQNLVDDKNLESLTERNVYFFFYSSQLSFEKECMQKCKLTLCSEETGCKLAQYIAQIYLETLM